MRLFIGTWPPESVMHGLAQTRHTLAEHAPRRCLRFTATEQIHLTLRFLGDIDDTLLPRLNAALTAHCTGLPAATLVVSGVVSALWMQPLMGLTLGFIKLVLTPLRMLLL